jgi:hypothetical protein
MKDKQQKTKSNHTDQELINIGLAVSGLIETGIFAEKKGKVLSFTFLKGLAHGFGTFLGGTVVVAVILLLFSTFQSMPIIGPFIKTLQNYLQK